MDPQSSAEMRARLRQWRQEHPQASFDEIEDAVQAEVARWQAQLVADVIQGAPPTEPPGAEAARGAEEAEEEADTAPRCASCGERMQRGGRRRREVLSRMGQPIRLERDYYVCPACGAGLFPPR